MKGILTAILFFIATISYSQSLSKQAALLAADKTPTFYEYKVQIYHKGELKTGYLQDYKQTRTESSIVYTYLVLVDRTELITIEWRCPFYWVA